MDPNVENIEWTQEEDEKLMKAQEEYGNHWSKIRKLFIGRSDNSIRNRYNMMMRAAERRIRRENKVKRQRLDGSSGAKASTGYTSTFQINSMFQTNNISQRAGDGSGHNYVHQDDVHTDVSESHANDLFTHFIKEVHMNAGGSTVANDNINNTNAYISDVPKNYMSSSSFSFDLPRQHQTQQNQLLLPPPAQNQQALFQSMNNNFASDRLIRNNNNNSIETPSLNQNNYYNTNHLPQFNKSNNNNNNNNQSMEVPPTYTYLHQQPSMVVDSTATAITSASSSSSSAPSQTAAGVNSTTGGGLGYYPLNQCDLDYVYYGLEYLDLDCPGWDVNAENIGTSSHSMINKL